MPNYRSGEPDLYQILFNATDRKFLIKIQMPPGVLSQPFTYVTDTKELFIICEYEEKYEMYRVNLNKYEDKAKTIPIYKLKKRLTLDRNVWKDIQAFHVRGGDLSTLDEVMANNKQIAFFIIDNHLYYWMNGMWSGEYNEDEMDEDDYAEQQTRVLNPVMAKKGKKEIPIIVDQAQFDVIDDSNIVISQRVYNKEVPVYRFNKISIDMSTWQVTTIYEESEQINEIENYGIDEKDNVIILLKKDKQSKKENKFYISIVEITEDFEIKTLYTNRVNEHKLIGHLQP